MFKLLLTLNFGNNLELRAFVTLLPTSMSGGCGECIRTLFVLTIRFVKHLQHYYPHLCPVDGGECNLDAKLLSTFLRSQ